MKQKYNLRWDSNPQPLDSKSNALSIAPRGHKVEKKGIDPFTSPMLTARSTI